MVGHPPNNLSGGACTNLDFTILWGDPSVAPEGYFVVRPVFLRDAGSSHFERSFRLNIYLFHFFWMLRRGGLADLHPARKGRNGDKMGDLGGRACSCCRPLVHPAVAGARALDALRDRTADIARSLCRSEGRPARPCGGGRGQGLFGPGYRDRVPAGPALGRKR